MMELANAFIANFTVQGHVLPLIQHVEVRVTVQCEQETIHLEIKNGAIKILQVNAQPSKYRISGKPNAIKQLFEGTAKLRMLERRGDLKVAATLRTILLLESIFFLTKGQENFAKVI